MKNIFPGFVRYLLPLMLLITTFCSSFHSYGQISITPVGGKLSATPNDDGILIGEVPVTTFRYARNPTRSWYDFDVVWLRSYRDNNKIRYVLRTVDWSVSFYGNQEGLNNLMQSMLRALEGQEYQINLGSSTISLRPAKPSSLFPDDKHLNIYYHWPDNESSSGKADMISLSKNEILQLFGK